MVVLVVLGATASTAHAINSTTGSQGYSYCHDTLVGINFYRGATWNWQSKLGVPRTKSNFKFTGQVKSCAYAKWIAQTWAVRAKDAHKKYTDHTTWLHQANTDPKVAICYYFGSYCDQAYTVAGCESGHTYYVGSKNGQYLGIFQMGDNEREKYGHGITYLEQAKAAYAYFVDSGKDWSPWECKPW